MRTPDSIERNIVVLFVVLTLISLVNVVLVSYWPAKVMNAFTFVALGLITIGLWRDTNGKV